MESIAETVEKIRKTVRDVEGVRESGSWWIRGGQI